MTVGFFLEKMEKMEIFITILVSQSNSLIASVAEFADKDDGYLVCM